LVWELPATSGMPLSRWSSAELADEAVTAGGGRVDQRSTVRRWLRRDTRSKVGLIFGRRIHVGRKQLV
jgi:hypothetical protein